MREAARLVSGGETRAGEPCVVFSRVLFPSQCPGLYAGRRATHAGRFLSGRSATSTSPSEGSPSDAITTWERASSRAQTDGLWTWGGEAGAARAFLRPQERRDGAAPLLVGTLARRAERRRPERLRREYRCRVFRVSLFWRLRCGHTIDRECCEEEPRVTAFELSPRRIPSCQTPWSASARLPAARSSRSRQRTYAFRLLSRSAKEGKPTIPPCFLLGNPAFQIRLLRDGRRPRAAATTCGFLEKRVTLGREKEGQQASVPVCVASDRSFAKEVTRVLYAALRAARMCSQSGVRPSGEDWTTAPICSSSPRGFPRPHTTHEGAPGGWLSRRNSVGAPSEAASSAWNWSASPSSAHRDAVTEPSPAPRRVPERAREDTKRRSRSLSLFCFFFSSQTPPLAAARALDEALAIRRLHAPRIINHPKPRAEFVRRAHDLLHDPGRQPGATRLLQGLWGVSRDTISRTSILERVKKIRHPHLSYTFLSSFWRLS